jgi:hypothetical protein
MLWDTATSPSHSHTPATRRIRTGGHLILDELLDEQGVAAGQPPEPLGTLGIDGALQDLLDDRAGCRRRQRLEVQPVEQLVLPQRGDGVGFAGPVRTVTTSRASRVCANWCTTCAEKPSSRCASSTPITTRP